MKTPPWIKEPTILFTTERGKTQGNNAEQHHKYNNAKWRNASGAFFRGKLCEHPGCVRLAACTDHIIRVDLGGSMWDRRNWQRLCNTHHAQKSARESKGYTEPSVTTPNGLIPKRNSHLPPDVAGQSHMIK